MSFADAMAADRRLVVLRALADAPGTSMNEGVTKTVLSQFGHHASTDMVRADLQLMADLGLLRIEKLDAARGEFWVAHLTPAGEDVATGRRTVPGIARRGAE